MFYLLAGTINTHFCPPSLTEIVFPLKIVAIGIVRGRMYSTGPLIKKLKIRVSLSSYMGRAQKDSV